MKFTIEHLEALAAEVEQDAEAERERLLRLCQAMGRILARRQPSVWKDTATSVTDETGHSDNSYPPKAESHGRGPVVLRVRGRKTEDVPTEGGFYYPWRRQTLDSGCYLGRDGEWYRSVETGTGRVGRYAAYPGDCERDIEIEWQTAEPTLEDLQQAEPVLRALLAEFLNGSAAA